MYMFVKQKSAKFEPITLTISSKTELADIVGALAAYGKGKTLAKKSIRQAGLLDAYSGNARKTARSIVVALAEEGGFAVPDFGRAKINDDLVDEALSGEHDPCNS
jgi:hypothetical protein